jgi:hypothetical protein
LRVGEKSAFDSGPRLGSLLAVGWVIGQGFSQLEARSAKYLSALRCHSAARFSMSASDRACIQMHAKRRRRPHGDGGR